MRAEKIGRDRQLHRDGGRAADAGFSLVELLIAVTILAIIVIPLLHLFVTSTRINVKSRQTLRATTVAQDIMEGLKAYTLEEVRTQFNQYDTDGKMIWTPDWHNPTEGFYVLNPKMIDGSVDVTELVGLEQDEYGNPTMDAEGNPVDPNGSGDIYYFGIKNLKIQGGEYDALIKLDASRYTIAKAKDGDEYKGGVSDKTGHDKALNGQFYADVMSVSETSGSEKTDSSYHEPADLSDKLMLYMEELIKDKYALKGETFPQEKWDKENVGTLVKNRTIRVEFAPEKEISAAGKLDSKCQAKIKFQYECVFDGEPHNISYGAEGFGDDDKVTGITRVFTSGNFYLFYYPIYQSHYDDYKDGDHIEFVIEKNDVSSLLADTEPLLRSVTLAKQVNADIKQSAGSTGQQIFVPKLENLYELERDYQATVNFATYRAESPQTLLKNPTLIEKLKYRSNIETNLASTNMSGKELTWEERELENIGLCNIPDDYLSLVGDAISGKTTNVIYDIEITVYEAGAAQYFGDPDFETNHADEIHRLATITNLD